MKVEEYLKMETENADLELTQFVQDLQQYFYIQHPENAEVQSGLERVLTILKVAFYGNPDSGLEFEIDKDGLMEQGNVIKEQRRQAIQRAKKLLKSVY